MAGKHINVPVLIFSSLVMISSVFSSSFPADDPLEYQTLLVPGLLPSTLHTKLEALPWDTEDQSQSQSKSKSEHTSNASPSLSLSLKLHNVDNLIMSRHDQGKITSETLFIKRLQRDALRANRIFTITKSSTISSPVISGLAWDNGEYFTRMAVGRPPEYLYMVMDTGSDIIWLQCLPCKKCYEQEDAIFNPNKSSSFHRVPCNSTLCDLLGNFGKCGKRKQCIYEEEFGDGSVTAGEFSTETLTFGKTTKMRKVAFGCGRYNKGLFVAAAGVLGLGRGNLSFLGQAGNKFGNKFSYCLANRWPNSSNSSSSSYLDFGDSPACGKAVYTPLVKNTVRDELNSFYYVGLEGFSVGGSLVPGINASMFDFDRKTGDGGVIVDSGTSVTRLTNHAYLALRDAFRKGTNHLKRTSLSGFILDTCYDLSGKKDVKVPTVVMHFHRGANMSLPPSNYMIPIPVDNLIGSAYCFAFAGTQPKGGLSIIGNIQQQSFGMVFDLPRKRLGFAPRAC